MPRGEGKKHVKQLVENSLLRECLVCQLVNEVCDHQFEWLNQAIESALLAAQRAEREACAKIADRTDSCVHEMDRSRNTCHCNIAAALRQAGASGVPAEAGGGPLCEK